MKIITTDMTDQEIKLALQEGPCKVTFRKKNGETRVLVGTTNMSDIDEEFHPTGAGTTPPAGMIRVFDLDKQGWRSFYADTIMETVES